MPDTKPPILVDTAELARMLGSPTCVVVDCRYNLMKPEAGRAAWAEAHIPGAFHADLDRDLAGPLSDSSGRHPLPNEQAFMEVLGRWSVHPESSVVVYDDAGGAIAARLWWLLKWAGHRDARILDGGWQGWINSGKEASNEEPALTDGVYP
ncbi:MAG: sulfurtransferase, partial [Gammaproteobacteria bacterium]